MGICVNLSKSISHFKRTKWSWRDENLKPSSVAAAWEPARRALSAVVLYHDVRVLSSRLRLVALRITGLKMGLLFFLKRENTLMFKSLKY